MRDKAYNIFTISYNTFIYNIGEIHYLIITAEYKMLSEFQRNGNHLRSSLNIIMKNTYIHEIITGYEFFL
jgi:hypothetical protein